MGMIELQGQYQVTKEALLEIKGYPRMRGETR